MQENYTKQTQRVIEEAKKAAYELDHSYIGTEHILTGLVCVDGCVSSVVLSNYGVSREKIEEFMDQLIAPMSPIGMREPEGFTPSAKKLLETSEKEAKRFQMPRIGTEHILLAILKETDSMAYRLLGIMGVNTQKLCVDTLIAMGEDPNRYKEYFQNGKPMKHKGKGKASMIEQYSKDLTKAADKQELDPVIGREEEIQRLIQILSRRTKNNPCLVGEPGVGKTAIVEGLAQRITMGNVPITLEKKRVLTLDLSGMVAGSKYRGEFEERIKRIVEEVKKDGNIILFIDEIHTIIGAGGAEGAIDASNILKPSLARGELQIIGATTQEEYRKYFERDAALERRFQPVTVEEATVEETVEILRGLKEKYEQHHSVKITEAAILAAAKLSNRYISERFLPDKAIDLMDEAASKTRLSSFVLPPDIQKLTDEIQKMEQQKEAAIIAEEFERAGEIKKKQEKKAEKLKKIQEKWEVEKTSKKLKIGEAEIAEVVTKWTKIPVQKMEKEESLRMQNLESILQKRVVGQEEAVHAVSKAIRRGRVGLKDPKRPIGSFLFLGPTGVGKTELSKALSEAVFGSEKAMIRVDMSEYMEKHSVSRLIGTPPGYVGYEEGGQLSEKVRKNPYSVILFDEIEKAHPDVFNILLQVLDDGRITDGHGRVVDFKNTVLIMTSNAGASRIIEPKKLGFAAGESEAQDYESMKRNVMEEVKKMFKPEFLNRIDDTIVFHSLTKADMRSIVTILIHDLVDRANNQVHIKLEVTNPAKDFIAQESYDKKYGARPLKRAIQDKVEDTLAEEILKGSVKAGDTMVVSVSDKKLKFTVKK